MQALLLRTAIDCRIGFPHVLDEVPSLRLDSET